MENMKEWLLGLDALILLIFIFGAFIAWELKSGEFPMRWFGTIHRDHRPFFYWMAMLFHFVILGVMVYAWMDGLRLPIGDLFE